MQKIKKTLQLKALQLQKNKCSLISLIKLFHKIIICKMEKMVNLYKNLVFIIKINLKLNKKIAIS